MTEGIRRRAPHRTRMTVAAVATAAFLAGAPEHVDAQNPAPGTIAVSGVSQSFTDLRQAIAAAAPGATLTIASGRYRGALAIAKPLTLSGIDTGAGLPTIDGGGQRVAIAVTAAGVTIKGFRMTSSGAPKLPFGIFSAYSEDGCIVVRAGGARIENNEISGCHYGIYLLGSDGTTIADNVITGNHEGGIFIRNSKRDAIRNNRIDGNGYSGIAIASVAFPPGATAAFRRIAGDVVITEDSRPLVALISEDIEIAGNSITRHGHGGIGIGYARRVTIADNKVADNGGAPLPKVMPPVALSVSSPNVRGFGIAINCDAYDNKVTGNEVTRNVNDGILIDTSYNNRIARNVVSASETGIQFYGAYGNVVDANKVRDNSDFGIRLERGAATNPPSTANLLFGNDLTTNRVNAFDTSGADRAAPRSANTAEPKEIPPRPADLTAANRWDNGAIGNHYSDFDNAAQGFIDNNGDGIGERAHPIPGGSATDHLPLTAAPVQQTKSEFQAPQRAVAKPTCSDVGAGCRFAVAAVFPSCLPH